MRSWSIARAAVFAAGDPSAWVIAALGFLARGGIFLLLALVLEIPSPITVTQIFGIDSITATGEPTPRLILTIAIAVALALLAVFSMIAVAAWTDGVIFQRVRDAGSTDAADVAGLAWLQSLGILPGLVGFVLAVPAVRDIVVSELLLPSQLDVPFVLRVIQDAEGPLVRTIIVVAVFEILVTIATRFYLAEAGRRSAARSYLLGVAEVARRPGAVVVAWLFGWAALVAAVAAALAAVALAWTQVRAVFLASDALASLSSIGRALGSGTLFAAVWVFAILLIGFASAFRSALWTYSVAQAPTVRPIAGEFATS